MFFGFSSTINSVLDHKQEAILRVRISHSLAGRRLTISIDSLEGAPTPSVALTSLTVDGVDVLDDAAGSGPWTYFVPSSASLRVIAWTVVATNGVAPDATAAGTDTVLADQVAPAFTTQPSVSPASGLVGTAFTLSEGVATGDPAPTLAGVLTLDGVDVTPVGLTYVSDAEGALAWTVTAANGVGEDAVGGASATVEALVAPSFGTLPADTLSARALTISRGSASGVPTPAISLTALALDGVDVLSEAVGAGPWSYVIRSSASAQTVTWEVTATNDAGSATARASVVVAADLSPPAAFTPGMWSLTDSPGAGGDALALSIASLPGDGGSAITALQYQVDSGSGYGAAQTLTGIETGARTITVISGALASVQVRAVNAVGVGEWSDAKTATPSATSGATSVTITQGEWTEVDLFDLFPASGAVSYTIKTGAAPAGMTFMAEVGLLHGAPTTPGDVSMVFRRTVNGIPADFLVTVIVEAGAGGGLPYAEFDGSSYFASAPAAASNATVLETSGNAVDLSVFIDAEFPATLAADMCFFQIAARHFFRVLANGRVQVQMDDTLSTLIIDATANSDVRGGRRRIGITANGGDGVSVLPSVTITVDGVAQSFITENYVLGNGLFHMTRKPYALLAETVGGAFGKIVPADVKVYQVAVWTNQNGAANHDWSALDAADLDASAIGAPLLYLGGTFAGVTGAYAGTLPFALTGAAPTVTASSSGNTTPLAKAGAVGFGRFATGGRGEAVYRVTNTSASGTNSLAWAISQAKAAGGGYILVEAEGPVELADFLEMDAPNTTVDGRRSPGLGYWLTQGGLWITADNVVVRHMRSYPGSNFVGQTPQNRDAFQVHKRTDGSYLEKVYLDRCDAMFTIDESISVYPWRVGSTAAFITFEGLLAADACHENLHLDEGVGGFDNHSKGPLINDTASKVTFYGNLFASLDDRAPRSLGSQIEFVSTVIANYNTDAITVGGGTNAFVNNFYMYGPAIGSSTDSHKLAQGILNANFTGVHDAGSFTGKWTQAAGFFTAGIESRWRYGNIGPNRTLFLNDTDNPGNFPPSNAQEVAISYSEAFLSLADRVGALNASGERHPFAQRVLNYVTAAVPFQQADGWYGAVGFQNAVPDEFRAIGGQIAGGTGQATVTLPVANAALPPVADRPWTSVEVTVLDAYTMEILDGLPRSPLTLPRTSKTWGADGVTQTGSLAGGTVVFNGLPAGFYVARVTYFAGSVPVRLYTGRPVRVA